MLKENRELRTRLCLEVTQGCVRQTQVVKAQRRAGSQLVCEELPICSLFGYEKEQVVCKSLGRWVEVRALKVFSVYYGCSVGCGELCKVHSCTV